MTTSTGTLKGYCSDTGSDGVATIRHATHSTGPDRDPDETFEVSSSFFVLVRDVPRDRIHEVIYNMTLGLMRVNGDLVEAISPEEFTMLRRISRSIPTLAVQQEIVHDGLVVSVRRFGGSDCQLVRLR